MTLLRIALAISVVLWTGRTTKTATAEPPNIIFILTDDQGWTMTSHRADPRIPESKSDFYETPHMDRLAQSGILFTQGYAPNPICSPTRNSVLFGQNAARHIYNKDADWYKKTADWWTIPKAIKAANPEYRTAHFGKWHIAMVPQEAGYDYDEGMESNGGGEIFGSGFLDARDYTRPTDEFLAKNNIANPTSAWRGGKPSAYWSDENPKDIFGITNRAKAFMKQCIKDKKPFFVQLSHYATHLSLSSRKESYDHFRNKQAGEQHTNPEFAAMLKDLDTGVGMILEFVRNQGIEDNTYIFLMGDNGGRLSLNQIAVIDQNRQLTGARYSTQHERNLPLRDGKHSFYEGGLRVPFMIAGPRIKPGSVCDVPVTGLDFLPTFAELAGYQGTFPASIDGGSLVPLLRDEGATTVQRSRESLIFHQSSHRKPRSAIRKGKYKLIKYWGKENKYEGTPKVELYDLSADLRETTDLSELHPALTHALEKELNAFLEGVNAETGVRDIKGAFYRLKDDLAAVSKTPQEVVVIHPIFRREPKPAGGQLASVNPPILLNPLVGEKKTFSGGVPEIDNPTFYSYRMSQDKSFPENRTTRLDNHPWAVFNPHQRLAPGTWFWQYRSNKTDWSEILSFRISGEVPVRETPSFAGLLSKIPKKHPRVLVPDGNLEFLRNRNRGNEDWKRLLHAAEKMLSADLPEEKLGIAARRGSTKVEQKKLALDASKKLGSHVQRGIDPLVKAYVLTGEEKYGRAAIDWALKVASYDPNGVSSVNNFADSQCMLQLALVYDACYQLLSPGQRELLLSGIVPRAHRFYLRWRNMLEAKVFSGHVWQHILERMFKTSLAVMDEVPDAKTWLHFLYDVYLARSPVLGPDDGGWWNGNHYVELNGITLLDIPMYLEMWTGRNFLDSPFYDNLPFWLIYSFPANSYSEGFGNGTEKQFGQKLGVLGFMDALSRIKQHPYARWYAEHQLKNGAISKGWDQFYFGERPAKKEHTIYDDDEFRWFRIKWDLPDLPPLSDPVDQLPLARDFRETGTVNMHTNLVEAADNLMVSIRSSPYGSTSHAHADQNSFNIQYGGQKLFYNSGYRPSMGVPHYQEWFKATIGHNSVLIDGKGQPGGSGESYGWIARFLQGGAISYALGDASRAYDNKFKEPQKAGMKLFRRHLVFLRPSYIVVYDELEAGHEAEWTWLLHSPYEITTSSTDPVFFANSSQSPKPGRSICFAEVGGRIGYAVRPQTGKLQGA